MDALRLSAVQYEDSLRAVALRRTQKGCVKQTSEDGEHEDR